MLVLSRKNAEKIHIGNDIVLHVLRSKKGTVKLGFEAPPDVAIVRAEIDHLKNPLDNDLPIC